jgi:ferredoxin-NADP reductase/nitrite reductase/ring-hydroxylating ferredoxin subunit
MLDSNTIETAKSRWHPIAAAYDLPYRHVFHGQLLGREFAVWRADDGFVNIWENRCLHRGVRLSIGINDGRELKCQYHGWRYANRSAGCTYIPAHPADAPARTIANRTYPSVERYGLIWTIEQPQGEEPILPGFEADRPFALRAIPVNAPADRVVAMLRHYRFQPTEQIEGEDASVSIESQDFSVIIRSQDRSSETSAIFFVQPVDSNRSVIRGVLDREPDATARMAVLRHHNERLSSLRDAVERDAANEPAPPPMMPSYQRLVSAMAAMPEPGATGRKAALRVQIARKWRAAEGIAGFELRPLNGLLPTSQPGAHIDVHLPNGQIRQYSLVNGPGESASFVIGVKRELDSRGGSICMHDAVREGDVLAISEPRNNFPLRRDATKTLLVAGGIGITPLLAMAQALNHSGLPHELHYFAQGTDHLAFPDRLKELGGALQSHLGLRADQTAQKLDDVFSRYLPGLHLYLCGPGPMLDAARRIAAAKGWPDDAVHFEFFKNTNIVDDSSSFEIALARSCMTLQVPAGRTILEVLRENGVDIASSCEQGACGTCAAIVTEGEPEHQDVYLNDAERRSGTKIMTCVSRAKSPRLVLDL